MAALNAKNAPIAVSTIIPVQKLPYVVQAQPEVEGNSGRSKARLRGFLAQIRAAAPEGAKVDLLFDQSVFVSAPAALFVLRDRFDAISGPLLPRQL